MDNGPQASGEQEVAVMACEQASAADVRRTSDLLRRIGLVSHRYSQGAAQHLAMPVTDVRAMGVLARADAPMSATDLGREVGLTPAAVSALLRRLDAHGHVERVADADDARRVSLEATDVARADSREAFAGLNGAIAAALDDIGEADRAVFVDVLARVHDHMALAAARVRRDES